MIRRIIEYQTLIPSALNTTTTIIIIVRPILLMSATVLLVIVAAILILMIVSALWLIIRLIEVSLLLWILSSIMAALITTATILLNKCHNYIYVFDSRTLCPMPVNNDYKTILRNLYLHHRPYFYSSATVAFPGLEFDVHWHVLDIHKKIHGK